jgi:hypothetical protein
MNETRKMRLKILLPVAMDGTNILKWTLSWGAPETINKQHLLIYLPNQVNHI